MSTTLTFDVTPTTLELKLDKCLSTEITQVPNATYPLCLKSACGFVEMSPLSSVLQIKVLNVTMAWDDTSNALTIVGDCQISHELVGNTLQLHINPAVNEDLIMEMIREMVNKASSVDMLEQMFDMFNEPPLSETPDSVRDEIYRIVNARVAELSTNGTNGAADMDDHEPAFAATES